MEATYQPYSEPSADNKSILDKTKTDRQAFSGISATNGERTKRRPARNDGPGQVCPEKLDDQSPTLSKIIFFGNGPLATYTLNVLRQHCDIIFHARTRADLTTAAELKRQNPDAHGVLASFGVLIKPDFLELFEPEGILNLHPSKLPEYRGASPIETAILAGDTDFSYSIMKLVKAMDAGPVYHQATLEGLPLDKDAIYRALATAGAEWLVGNLKNLPVPTPQDDDKATFTTKFDKSLSFLQPASSPAETILRQIVAYQGFPKPKYNFFGKTCIILKAHVLRVTDILCEAAGMSPKNSPLMLKCQDRNFVVVDELQPEGKKPMDARSFVNGYGQNH